MAIESRYRRSIARSWHCARGRSRRSPRSRPSLPGASTASRPEGFHDCLQHLRRRTARRRRGGPGCRTTCARRLQRRAVRARRSPRRPMGGARERRPARPHGRATQQPLTRREHKQHHAPGLCRRRGGRTQGTRGSRDRSPHRSNRMRSGTPSLHAQPRRLPSDPRPRRRHQRLSAALDRFWSGPAVDLVLLSTGQWRRDLGMWL